MHLSVPQSTTPPHAPDLEASVLGALLLEQDTLLENIHHLQQGLFHSPQNEQIRKAIIDLYTASQHVDARSVVAQLRKNGQLKAIGGAAYITQLIDAIASPAHLLTHIHILKEYAIRRDILKVAKQLQVDSLDDTIDALELLENAENTILSIGNKQIRKDFKTHTTLTHELISDLQSPKIQSIPSGYATLDKYTGGFKPGELILLAARPSMGKTTLMLNFALNATISQHPAAIFSLEMTSREIIRRLLSAKTSVPNKKLQQRNLDKTAQNRIQQALTDFADTPIYIDDSSLSLFELRAKCRRLKTQHGVNLVFIDYLQLLKGENDRRIANREQEIASISRNLKALAKDLNLCIVVLSQLNRSLEQRSDKKPMLSDFRDSGAIEENADIALFIHRPEYYGITQDENLNDTTGLATIIIAKNRNGQTGKTTLRFRPDITKFEPLSNETTPF